MYILPLSENASFQLTKSVVCYQKRHTDQSLYRTLHEQTQQLLYELPLFLHLIDEEDCCEFLFFCYDSIPYYLNTYREGRLSYIGYLSQVVRKRSRYFIAQKQIKKKKERLLAESDFYHQQTTFELPEETAEQAMYCRFSSVVEQDIATLPSLFSELLEHRSHPTIMSDPKLLELQNILRHQVNRKRFLIMLTLSPHLAAHYLLEDLASLLEVSPALLIKYLNTANSVLAQKRACKQEFETISHRHFRRLLEIESELLREEDETKRLKLERLRIWNQRVYKAKVKQIRTMELNLSHSELGNLLGIPKGTIDSSVHYMKHLLLKCMDEQGDNEYL